MKMSDRAIAKEVGCTHPTIMKYRRTLEIAGEIEPIERREGMDGKTYSGGNNLPPEKATETKMENLPPEPDPYSEWFDSHVLCGDMFEILPTIDRKFDLIFMHFRVATNLESASEGEHANWTFFSVN